MGRQLQEAGFDGSRARADTDSEGLPRTLVSVIVPTRNEELNVAPLVTRAQAALAELDVPAEIVFVDDSDDATPEAIRVFTDRGNGVRLVHRDRNERAGGLSGAVLAGVAAARGAVLAVMDGDLQHPPEVLPRLLSPVLAGEADIAAATRYKREGRRDGLDGSVRRVVSGGSRKIVRVLLPRTRPVSDPLGGFFVFRRGVVEGTRLAPDGFKILLEILVRGRWDRVVEIPYTFAAREKGASKASLREGLRFGLHLLRLMSVPRAVAPPAIDLASFEPTREVVASESTRDLVASEPMVAASPDQYVPGRTSTAAAPNVVKPGWPRSLRAIVSRVARSAVTRALVATALVLAAYWYSLHSLVAAWSPGNGATLSCLVPFVALPLFAYFAAPAAGEPAIHDREVDYLVGVALLSVALFVLWSFQHRMGIAFWVDRIDLLSLPVFVAGVLALVFGTRAMWRLRLPVLFLFLAWPPTLRVVANGLSGPLGEATGSTLRTVARRLGGVRVGDGVLVATHGTMYVGRGWGSATVVLMVGLIALAASLAWLHSAVRRVIFIAVAMTLAWIVNAGRLVFAIAAANGWNTAVARSATKTPAMIVSALVAFELACIALPRLARTWRLPVRDRAAAPVIPRARLSFAVIAVAALGAGVVTSGLNRFAPLTDALGRPRATAVSAEPVPGYRLLGTAAKRHSIEASDARRYSFAWKGVAANVSDVRAGARVQVDVLVTGDPGQPATTVLRRYFALQAYRHVRSASVALGHGVRGEELRFSTSQGLRWTALTWVWPVRGDDARYERVVVEWGDPATLTAAQAGARSAAFGASDPARLRLFAHTLVAAHFTDPGTPRIAVQPDQETAENR